MANNTKHQHRAVIAHASNRVNCEMNRNRGSQRGYLAYQRHQRLTDPDLQAGKDQAWHYLNFSLISPRARTWKKKKKGLGSKCSIEEKSSWSSYSNLFPLSHNEQLIILWLRVPQHTQGNKLLPIQSISSSHRAQVITSCSTSLQQIVSVTDKATLLFSAERISVFFFFFFLTDSLSIVKDLPDGTWGRWYWSDMLFRHFGTSLFLSVCLLLIPPQPRGGWWD